VNKLPDKLETPEPNPSRPSKWSWRLPERIARHARHARFARVAVPLHTEGQRDLNIARL
jgi:hypothetical protein